MKRLTRRRTGLALRLRFHARRLAPALDFCCMVMRFKTLHPHLAALAVLFILCLAGFTCFFGPLDTLPRLHASAQSPDGEFTVKVYRRRVSLPPSSEIDLIARVYDRRGDLMFEKEIFEEGMWSENGHIIQGHCI